jgi:glycosyltransferase involved in cell wall biosynthesis
MRIVFLSDDFPPQSLGGAGIAAFNLACGLQKTGHRVFVITTCQEKSNEGKEDYLGLDVFRIFANFHPRWRAYLGLYNPQTVKKVTNIMREIKPDIVHAHNLHRYLSYYCLKLAKRFSKAVFLTAHDTDIVYSAKWAPKDPQDLKITIFDQIREGKKRYNPFRNTVIRHLLKYADKVFVVSHALKKLLETNGIGNMKVVHNGINAGDWQVDHELVEGFQKKYSLQGKKIILFGGRISGLKGVEQINRAMIMVKERIPEAILVTLGNGGLGWLNGDELKAAYSAADIVVTPSIYFDPFPTVNLEAMACRKPIVATCFGGSSELVQDGKTGFIIDPRNIKLLAEKIIYLLENPQEAQKFGEAGYERVKRHFNLETQVSQTLNYYRNIL